MEHARCQPGDPAHPFRAIYRAAAGWHSRQRPRPHPNAAPELTFKVEVKRGRPGRSLLELSGDTDLLVIGASDTRSGPAHAPPRLDKTRAATYQLHLGALHPPSLMTGGGWPWPAVAPATRVIGSGKLMAGGVIAGLVRRKEMGIRGDRPHELAGLRFHHQRLIGADHVATVAAPWLRARIFIRALEAHAP
jgi:hypothetical protein